MEDLRRWGVEEAKAQNVGTARQAFQIYTDGGVDAVMQFWADDCVWNDPPEFPDSGVFRGKDEVAARLEELGATLPLKDLVVEEAIPVSESDVLLILGFHATGGGSGVPVDQQMGCILTFRNGLATEWRMFLNGAEARREAGL